MAAANPDPTLDLRVATRLDLARSRYDAAWQSALFSGSPPPDRESFLLDAGDERAALLTVLDTIDSTYDRLRRMVREGVVSISPTAPDPKPVVASPSPPAVSPSQLAPTMDSVPAEGADPRPASNYGDTLDSAPRAAPAPAPEPLREGATVGSYELLGVIAQGGMGVVYKARHTRLNRNAAIKMVLAGVHASADQLARFRAEARVVARLQHPNVVQLYEVGEHDGLPYIALEFVEGGSLAHKAGGQPQPPQEAAGQVELLARAMQHAHEHGIVHRDLKPANVLLTPDGVPKVTDFGLAKQLEGEGGNTRSGTLMGTPSYMAPEQARGEQRNIGPLTDVYALGAVLYELLTGRPPYAGATPLETVMAVLKTEPVPPTRLQPDVPRDLETICLKCLEKDPKKRYASAGELANDLRRFLAGDTILARPVGRAERLWRWCKRNPGVAALTAAVLLLLTTVAAGSTAAALRIRAEKRTAEENAVAAREAQTQAELALAEAERQKTRAQQNETAARTAQTQAEQAKTATEKALAQTEIARADADKARIRADTLATVAAKQRELALDALGGLVNKVQDQLDDLPGAQRVKQELLGLALGGLRQISASGQAGAATDIRMAEGHRRLGDLAQRLGDLALARENYEQVHQIVKLQAAANPGDTTWQRAVSVAEARLGDLHLLTGDRVGARRHYDEARKIREELAKDKENLPAKVDLAQVYVKLGDVSDPARAVELFRESLRLREELLAPNPKDPNARRDVRISHFKLADAHLKTGDAAAARPHADKAVEIAESLAREYPKVPQLKTDLAWARAKLGDVSRAQKKPEEALKQYQEAVRVLDPVAAQNQRDLVLQITHGILLAHAGRHVDAARVAARVRDQAPQNAHLLYNVACVYAIAADALAARPAADRTPEEEKLVTGYGELALDCLKAALAAGFADHELVRTDPELAPVRALPGFAEVAKKLR